MLPEEVDTSDGSKIPLQSRDGRNWMGIVTETQGDEIHLDLNHPLAGKTLTFKVEVLSRTDSTTADLTEETED